MAYDSAIHELPDVPFAAANDSPAKAKNAPLQAFFQALAKSREEKEQRVVAEYLAVHGDHDLIRFGYAAAEIQALRLEASIWLLPMI